MSSKRSLRKGTFENKPLERSLREMIYRKTASWKGLSKAVLKKGFEKGFGKESLGKGRSGKEPLGKGLREWKSSSEKGLRKTSSETVSSKGRRKKSFEKHISKNRSWKKPSKKSLWNRGFEKEPSKRSLRKWPFERGFRTEVTKRGYKKGVSGKGVRERPFGRGGFETEPFERNLRKVFKKKKPW